MCLNQAEAIPPPPPTSVEKLSSVKPVPGAKKVGDCWFNSFELQALVYIGFFTFYLAEAHVLGLRRQSVQECPHGYLAPLSTHRASTQHLPAQLRGLFQSGLKDRKRFPRWLSSKESVVQSLSREDPLDSGGKIPSSPGGGHGNPLQYSCLKNPVDRGAWRAAAPEVTKSRT